MTLSWEEVILHFYSFHSNFSNIFLPLQYTLYCNINTMTGKKLLLTFSKAHRSRVLGVLVLGFWANAVTLLLPLVIAQTYSLLFDFQSARGRLLEKFGIGWQADFNSWLAFLPILILIKAILDFFRKSEQGKLTETFLHWLRQRLFLHQLRMEVRHYEERGVGRYLLRFSGDLSSVQQFLSKGILQFSADMLLVMMGLALLFWLDSWLGGLMLIASLLLGGVVLIINRQIGKLETQRRDQKSALLSFINLRLLNIASLKAFNKETPELQQFDRRAGKIQRLGFSYHRWAALLEALVPFAVYAALALAFLLVYNWKQSGYAFQSDNIFAFILILLALRNTLSRTLRIGLVWKKGNISLQKIAKLLQQSTESNWSKPELNFKQPTLQLTGVALQFHDNRIFENLHFTLSPGKRGVIIGKSGSGKSALVKMLAGLYQPSAGQIYLDVHSTLDLHPKSLRRLFAFVSDALPLYGKTVSEALAYSPRHRAKALHLFQDWQHLFPSLESIDFQTPMRETGRLSGTQSQLLLWLRALLTGKPFLILDEPFQNLDTETAQKLWQQIPTDCAVLLLTANTATLESLDIQLDWYLNLEKDAPSEKLTPLTQ